MSNVRDHQRTQPAIRFKGFTDVWEKRKLGEVADFFDGQRIPIESGTRQRGKYPYYGATGIIDYVQDYIFDGEYVLLAEDGANITMRTSPLTYITSGKFWLNNHAHVMRSREGSNNFLQSTLENINYEKFNSGTAQPKLNAKTVKSLVILLPSVEEQTKIGVFFQRLDHLIAVNQRKGDVLQNLKKGLLQRLFASETSPIPDIRFKGFTDAWEKRKLSRGMDEYTDRVFVDDSKVYNQVSVKNIGEIELRGSAKGSLIGRKRQAKINLDDHPTTLVFTRQTIEQGGIGFAPSTTNGAIVTENMPTISVNVKVFSKSFLSAYFKTSAFRNTVILPNIKGGTAQVAVHESDVLASEIQIPKLDEQNSIGRLCELVDNLIAATQRKGEVLKNLKKALLQKMFV